MMGDLFDKDASNSNKSDNDDEADDNAGENNNNNNNSNVDYIKKFWVLCWKFQMRVAGIVGYSVGGWSASTKLCCK